MLHLSLLHLITIAGLGAPAHAYQLSGSTLVPADASAEGDTGGPSTVDLAWWVEADATADGLSADQQIAAVTAAWQAWDDAAPCVDLSASYLGTVDRGESSDLYDGDMVFAFGDPEGTLDSGSPAEAWLLTGSQPMGDLVVDGQALSILPVTAADVTFNGGLAWTTLAAGACTDQVIAEVLALRQVGTLLGLAPSCTSDTAASADCTDDEQAAAMFWDADLCDSSLAVPQNDDVRGLLALATPIGTPADWSSAEGLTTQGDTAVVAAGTEHCLTRATLTGADQSVTWDLGDSTVIDGSEACHSWTDPGVYNIGLSTLSSAGPSCSDDAWAQILSCSAPAMPAGQTQLFAATLTDVSTDGGTVSVRLFDTTNDDRCVSSVAWDISQSNVTVDSGSGVLEEFVLPPGTWKVAVTINGVAGTLDDSMDITIAADQGQSVDDTGTALDESAGGCGCSGLPASAGLSAGPSAPRALLMLLPLVGLLGWRRRSRG